MNGNAIETMVKEPQVDMVNTPTVQDSPSGYSVNIEMFHGPMDLLLYLIEKDELDIYNIPIGDITGQYLEYIEIMRMFDIDAAGEFILMAARLMQIKARMLLPSGEGEDEEIDPRSELIQALVEYKRIRKAAEMMSDRETLARMKHWTRASYNGDDGAQYAELEVNLFDLLKAFREISLRKPIDEKTYDIEPLKITVEDRIEYVLSVITPEGLRFAEILGEADTRLVLIVTFIALLELVRLHRLTIKQNITFGEIWIYRN